MMRYLIGICGVFVCLIGGGLTTNANEVGQTIVANIEGDWDVDVYTRANGAPSGECTMRGEYSNDIEVTFKGKKGQLTAVRVRDLGGADGSPITGFIGLGLDGNSYGLQAKSGQGVIDASLLTVPAPAEKIIDLGLYSFRIGIENYNFSTKGFADAYAKLLKCQGHNDIPTMRVVNEPIMIPINVEDHIIHDDTPEMPAEPIDLVVAQDLNDYEGDIELSSVRKNGENIPLMTALPMIVPQNYSFKLDRTIDPLKPISWESQGLWFETLMDALEPLGYSVLIEDRNIRVTLNDSSPQKKQVNITTEMKTWSADKGDKLSVVLAQWAEEANIKPDIDLDRDVTLAKDFKIYGPLDIAVNQLLIETIGANSISAYVENGDGDIVKIAEQDMNATPSQNKMQKTSHSPQQKSKWRALQGTDLKKVLKNWSLREDIDFVWNADQQFLIKKTTKTMANYNDAVTNLLNQYNDQDYKPLGALNIDPDTGKKTLIITVEKSS